MNSYTIIDNFLSESEHQFLKKLIYFNNHFPFYFRKDITFPGKIEEIWSWYGVHLLYEHDVPNSTHFKDIYSIFYPKIKDAVGIKSFIRMKINFYPHTESLKEHSPHGDYPYIHNAAIFSLNTCDGFTRLSDGTKVDSIENRMLFFDGSSEHNSTTTTTDSGRFNINFNWL